MREMLDFSVKNNPETVLIPVQQEAYKTIARGEANFRFVIDMKSLEQKSA